MVLVEGGNVLHHVKREGTLSTETVRGICPGYCPGGGVPIPLEWSERPYRPMSSEPLGGQ